MLRDPHSWLPLAVLALGGLAAWAVAQGRANGKGPLPEPPPPAVAVVAAEPRDVPLFVRTHGTVEPGRVVELVAEVAGRAGFVAPLLEPGAFFEAGVVLVELDRADAELALERAEATVQRRESELRLAEARLVRRRSLGRSEVASEAQIEEAEHAERSARAGLREARAAREEARRNLARTRIVAPFAGRTRSKRVDEGQFVVRGMSLASVYAVDFAELRLPVPVADLADLALPLGGGELADGPRVTLRASLAGSVVAWSARVVRVEGEISPRTRMLYVVARVDDPFGRGEHLGRTPLPPGLFVEAEIEGRVLEGAFELPREALRPPDEVFVVDGAGRLRTRRVEVLRVESDRVLAGAGLAPGEQVRSSAVGAVEGLRVRAVPGPAAAAPVAIR